MIAISTLFETSENDFPPQLPIGKNNHIPDDDFDQEQLDMGIRVEFEHTDNPEYAKAIAKDHLCECSDYYTRLHKMEAECQEEDAKK